MPKTPTQIVGEKIRQARWDMGLSQERFAAKVGTSRRNIMRWEGGQHMPRYSQIVAIAQASGKPLSFFEIAPAEGEGDDEEDADLPTVREQELLEALRPLARLLARAEA